MRRLDINGGWYPDVAVSGEYACPRKTGLTVETHLGPISTLALALSPLYTRIARDPFRFAGAATDAPVTVEWRDGRWHEIPVEGACVSPVLYDRAGVLHIADAEIVKTIGTNGWRYVATDGQFVTGDATYFDRATGLCEWTDLGDDLRVGQFRYDAFTGVAVWDRGVLRVLHRVPGGQSRFVRANREGAAVAVAWYDAISHQAPIARLVWTTVDELRALTAAVDTLTAPVIAPFGRHVGVGLFKVTTAARVTDGPGHFEVLTDGVPWQLCRDKTRPLIADLQSAPSVPEGKLLALFAVVDRDSISAATRFAERNRVPVIWYDDVFPFRSELVPLAGYWMVKGYPTATPAALDVELTRLEAIHLRLMLAWPVYLQQPPTWDLIDVVSTQAALADVVRRHPSVVLLGCFSGAGRDNGIGTYPVLAECYARLLAASDGLPDLADGPVPVPVPPDPGPDPVPEPPDPIPIPPIPALGGAILMADISGVLHHYGKIDLGNGKATYTADPASGAVWSAQPDGSLQTRPKDTTGDWEQFKADGAIVTAKSAGVLNSYVAVDVSGL